jgi:hypothetical protein
MVHIKIGVRICGSLDSLDRRHTAAGLVGRDVMFVTADQAIQGRSNEEIVPSGRTMLARSR